MGNKSDLLSDKEWEAFKLKVETDLRMISRGLTLALTLTLTRTLALTLTLTKVETDLKMISWAPLVRASVLTGQGVEEAMEPPTLTPTPTLSPTLTLTLTLTPTLALPLTRWRRPWS